MRCAVGESVRFIRDGADPGEVRRLAGRNDGMVVGVE
jgi:hypothetical protein